MRVLCPSSVAHAVAALADDPQPLVIAGGTDFMVDVNAGRIVPDPVISVAQIPEIRTVTHDAAAESVRIGAAVTLTELGTGPVVSWAAALADAARSIGSVQVRNGATLGGNVGTGSPAGDTLPVLVALEASVELVSRRGRRCVPIEEFLLGPKVTARHPDELIVAVHVPVIDGHQCCARVGGRNAMATAVCSAALVVDRGGQTVRLALGAVGPTVIRAREAEVALAAAVDWDTARFADAGSIDLVTREFGALAATACLPTDDHRATGEYRRHAAGVLAGRLARKALT